MLLWIKAFFYLKPDEAEEFYTKELMTLDPNGALYHFLAGYVARENGRIEDALIRFKACEESSTEFIPMSNIGTYEMGWCH